MFVFMWGRLAVWGGLVTRLERRLPTGAQLDKLPHKLNTFSRSWYSIDPGTAMIRARRAAHLSNLQKRFPALADARIPTLPNRAHALAIVAAHARSSRCPVPAPRQ